MGFFTRIIVTSIVFMGANVCFPNNFHVSSITIALLASVVLSVLNVLLKPLVMFLSLPFLLLTFGLFSFVINAIMLQVTSLVVGQDNFGFSSFFASLVLAVVMALVYSVVTNHFKEVREAKTNS